MRRKAHRAALEAARDAYEAWCFWKLQELADEYQELIVDQGAVESAYRALRLQPGWFSETEIEWWEGELERIYDKLPLTEYLLDILTFQKNKAQRFEWWQEEEAGRL